MLNFTSLLDVASHFIGQIMKKGTEVNSIPNTVTSCKELYQTLPLSVWLSSLNLTLQHVQHMLLSVEQPHKGGSRFGALYLQH